MTGPYHAEMLPYSLCMVLWTSHIVAIILWVHFFLAFLILGFTFDMIELDSTWANKYLPSAYAGSHTVYGTVDKADTASALWCCSSGWKSGIDPGR